MPGGNRISGDAVTSKLADFLLRTLPIGVIVMDNNLAVAYRNTEGKRFLDRYGLPEEVPRIGRRILEAFYSGRLMELFPGEVYIEKRLGESTSKWLFRLHVTEEMDEMLPRVVVYIMEETVPNNLSMNEIRLRYRFTRRETDVLRRVLEGLKNSSIAEELNISEQTVEDHLGSICTKVGVGNRNDLMRIFIP